MVCARAIRGLRGQSMVCGTNHGSRVCAGQSRDCANPCFAHNIYTRCVHHRHAHTRHIPCTRKAHTIYTHGTHKVKVHTICTHGTHHAHKRYTHHVRIRYTPLSFLAVIRLLNIQFHNGSHSKSVPDIGKYSRNRLIPPHIGFVEQK